MFKANDKKYKDKLFHSLIQNSDTIYALYDPFQENVIYITKNVSEVLGIREYNYEFVNTTIHNILTIPIIKDELERWDKQEEFVSGMVSYHAEESEDTKWIRVKIYPYYDKKRILQIILISDATIEHERQHMLVTQASDIKTREQKLNQITSITYDTEMTIQVGTGVFSLKNLKDANHYFGENKTGNYKKELAKIVEEYVHSEDQKMVEKAFNDIEKQAEENRTEPTYIKYRLKDTDLTLESVSFYTSGKNGDFITILTKDVTENAECMKRQNAILEKALAAAEDAARAKDEFLTIMSHEIRTPMNVIIGLSESVLNNDGNLTADIKEDIENINTASNNLLEVIDGLLDISKIEKGNNELEEKEYDVAKLLKDLEAFAREKIDAKKVVFEMAVDPTIPSTLFGDVAKIRQICQNILNNACQYTVKGSVILEAKWSGNKETGKLNISISDTGKGISATKLKNLFKEDAKTDGKKQYVSGMGLYISKKYIDLLNGEIEAESTVGKGSCFTVKINQKVINDKQIGDIYAHKTVKKTVNTFDAKGKRILIVDDDKLNSKVAVRLLKPYNVETTSVTSGKECISLLKTESFDLILLDQMMPEMSGTETLHKLQEEKIKTPCIMLTADAMVGKKELYLKAGFDDYLSKPINTEELNRVLKKFLK